jgi:hypothetical protein
MTPQDVLKYIIDLDIYEDKSIQTLKKHLDAGEYKYFWAKVRYLKKISRGLFEMYLCSKSYGAIISTDNTVSYYLTSNNSCVGFSVSFIRVNFYSKNVIHGCSKTGNITTFYFEGCRVPAYRTLRNL